jgi:phosphoglycerate dehydrogenase-like enzyme
MSKIDELKIVSFFPFSSESQEKLRHILQMDLLCISDPDEFLAQCHKAQIICSHWLPINWHEIAPNLLWIQSSFAGVNALPSTLLSRESGVTVTTARGIHATSMSEYVFGSILMFNRSWPYMLDLQKKHLWPLGEQWSLLTTRELKNQTIGIIGLGHVGRRVAQLGRAFGMQVVATRRSVSQKEQDADIDHSYSAEHLLDMLRISDYVVLAVPLTSKTFKMIGEVELRTMRPHTYLVNVSRGQLIDEIALIRALKEGWIAGAGLDVTEMEPLPTNSPLYEMPNVILTPHISGESVFYDTYLADLFADNLSRYCAGIPLHNQYDQEREY